MAKAEAPYPTAPSVAVVLLAPSGLILSITPVVAAWCGFELVIEELPTIWDLLEPGDVADVREQMGGLVIGAMQSFTCLQRMRQVRGGCLVVQASYSVLLGTSQLQIVLTMVPIDGAKQADNCCSDQSSLLQTILNHVDAHIYMKDRDGRYLYANPSARKVLAPLGGSVIGKTDAELLPPEQAMPITALDREVFEHGGPLVQEERLVTTDGSEQIFLSQKLIHSHGGSGDYLIGLSTDITDVRRASEQLAASEERFRLLAENSSDVVLWLAKDGLVRWVSPSLTDALGWRPEEWIGKLGTDFLLHRGCAEHYRTNHEHLQQGGCAVVAREQVMAKDGSVHWIETHANPYINGEGDVDGIVASFHVIDEMVLAEQLLRQSEQRHRRLADHMLDVVWAINLNGRFTYMSPSVQRVRGFSPEELMAMELEQQFPPQSLAVVLAGLEQARCDVAAGCPVWFEAEIEEYCKDGTTVWTEVRATSLYDEQGQFVEIVGVSRDVTTRHRLRDELRISEERYRLLAENARDVIWTMTAEGTISYISPSIERLRGLSPEVAMRQSWDQIHPPASLQHVKAYWEQMMADIQAGFCPQPFRGELEYYCSNGLTIWADVIAMPILTPSGQLRQVIGASRDITERKRYEAQLQLANQKLQAMATHDGLTGIWNRNRLSEEIREAISRAERYGDDLALILCDIDHFKSINDCFGHRAGDLVLIEFCKRIQLILRESDRFARWGGEEFLIFLPRSDSAGAAALAEKLRYCISEQPFAEVGTVTASFGVAQRQLREHDLAWFQRVDQQLYAAKNGGRNRVAVADSAGSNPIASDPALSPW